MKLKSTPDFQFKTAAVILFLFLFGVGVFLSLRKPLWSDEIYTQVGCIDRYNYAELFHMRNQEGNNAPLFYVVQKAVCDIAQYEFPETWDERWNFSDPRSQVVVRIASNVFMSAALALLFWFFANHYSLGFGLYALGIGLISPMVWGYWVEGRPYSLWFLLTVIQCALFLALIREKETSYKLADGLIMTHILLAFTTIFSLPQIVIISAVLFALKDRNIPRYVFLFLIPTGICVFYYVLVKNVYGFISANPFVQIKTSLVHFFGNTAEAGGVLVKNLGLIERSFPLEHIAIVFLFAALLSWSAVAGRAGSGDNLPAFSKSSRVFVAVTAFHVLAALLILAVFSVWISRGQEGFALSKRYFIFLAPFSVFAAVVCSRELIRRFKEKPWLLYNTIIVLGGLFLIRGIRTALDIYLTGLY